MSFRHGSNHPSNQRSRCKQHGHAANLAHPTAGTALHGTTKPGEVANALVRMTLARCFAACRMARLVRVPAA
jgi:hypothetical protein